MAMHAPGQALPGVVFPAGLSRSDLGSVVARGAIVLLLSVTQQVTQCTLLTAPSCWFFSLLLLLCRPRSGSLEQTPTVHRGWRGVHCGFTVYSLVHLDTSARAQVCCSRQTLSLGSFQGARLRCLSYCCCVRSCGTSCLRCPGGRGYRGSL